MHTCLVRTGRQDTFLELRGAIEAHGGHIFKTMGDQFCAAFTTGPEALAAAVDAQQALAAEPWDDVGALRHIFGRAPDRPSLFGVMVQSLNIMQDRITRSRMAGEPPDVAINPRLGHLGLLEFHRADEAIAEGRKAAERALPELRDAISLFAG